MPRFVARTPARRRARLILAGLMIAAGLAAAPPAAAAGPSGASAGAAPPATYEALCGPVPAPFARCDALRRTDIAVVPALAPGATTSAGGASPAVIEYTPSDLRAAYGLPSSGGGGRTVAIIDAYDLPTAAADLAVYRTQFGLPACTVASGCFRKVDEHGGTSYPPAPTGANAGWGGEIELDMDMVSAICPGCKILLVEANTSNLSDLGTAVDTAVRLGAVAVSNSYGGYEWAAEGALDAHYNHPGVAITAATGDYGWADGVEYPAASPYVISVGGTTLNQPTPGVWTQTAWADGGSGCSALRAQALLADRHRMHQQDHRRHISRRRPQHGRAGLRHDPVASRLVGLRRHQRSVADRRGRDRPGRPAGRGVVPEPAPVRQRRQPLGRDQRQQRLVRHLPLPGRGRL